jgi:hypothetical protein
MAAIRESWRANTDGEWGVNREMQHLCARTASARVPTPHVEPILHLSTVKAFSISLVFLKPKAENLTLEKLPALAAHCGSIPGVRTCRL